MHERVQPDFEPDEISVLITDREGKHREAVEHDTGVAKGAVSGIVVALPAAHERSDEARETFRGAGADAVREWGCR